MAGEIEQVGQGRRKVTMCPHKEARHYAKGMCNHCYHRFGRLTKASACPHTDQQVYAKGKCLNCYINDYGRKKRDLKAA